MKPSWHDDLLVITTWFLSTFAPTMSCKKEKVYNSITRFPWTNIRISLVGQQDLRVKNIQFSVKDNNKRSLGIHCHLMEKHQRYVWRSCISLKVVYIKCQKKKEKDLNNFQIWLKSKSELIKIIEYGERSKIKHNLAFRFVKNINNDILNTFKKYMHEK